MGRCAEIAGDGVPRNYHFSVSTADVTPRMDPAGVDQFNREAHSDLQQEQSVWLQEQ